MRFGLKKVWFVFALLLTLVTTSCGDKSGFVQTQSSGTFLQEFNPEYLDVLWVVDDRSTLFPIQSQLINEAKTFFQRLEGMRQSYRMAFITSDMLIAKGRLRPLNKPLIVERNMQDTKSYVSLFANALTSLIINLGTGAEAKAFEASDIALNNYFKPRAGVPLVVIYISDSEDRSSLPDGVMNAVEHYSSRFLSLKGGDARLLKVYSINYTESGSRCTGSQYNADIDKKNPDGTSAYEGRFFKMAQKLGGDTADICGSFANLISLDGLRLKTIPNRFKLDKPANEQSLTIRVITADGQSVTVPYHYEADTNEVVFDAAPPEGSRIQFSYLPK